MSESIKNEMNGNLFKNVFNNTLLNTEDNSQDILGPLFIKEGILNKIEIDNISMEKSTGYIKMLAEHNTLKIANKLFIGDIKIENAIINNINEIKFGNLTFNNNLISFFNGAKTMTQGLYDGNIRIDCEGFSSKCWGYGNVNDSNILNTNTLALTTFDLLNNYSVLYIKPPYNNKGNVQNIDKSIMLARQELDSTIKNYYINGTHNNNFNHEALYILYNENTKNYNENIGSKGVCFLGVQNKNADFNGIWIRSCNINGGEYSAEKYSSLYVNSPNNKDNTKRNIAKDIINIDTGNKSYNLYGEYNMKEVFLKVEANSTKNNYSLKELGVDFYPNLIILRRYGKNDDLGYSGFMWYNGDFLDNFNSISSSSKYTVNANLDLNNFVLGNLSSIRPIYYDKYYNISFYYV